MAGLPAWTRGQTGTLAQTMTPAHTTLSEVKCGISALEKPVLGVGKAASC